MTLRFQIPVALLIGSLLGTAHAAPVMESVPTAAELKKMRELTFKAFFSESVVDETVSRVHYSVRADRPGTLTSDLTWSQRYGRSHRYQVSCGFTFFLKDGAFEESEANDCDIIGEAPALKRPYNEATLKKAIKAYIRSMPADQTELGFRVTEKKGAPVLKPTE